MKHVTVGMIVYHERHGRGVVIEEWRGWLSCPECFVEIPQAKRRPGITEYDEEST